MSDDNSLMAVPSATPFQDTKVGDGMDSRDREMHAGGVSNKQGVVIDNLMGTETDSGAINAVEEVEEVCEQSNMGESEMVCGLMSSGQEDNFKEAGPVSPTIPIAHAEGSLVTSGSGEPISFVGPIINQVEEVYQPVLPSVGNGPGLRKKRVGGLKFGARPVRFANVGTQELRERGSEIWKGKRKFERMDTHVSLESNKARKIGESIVSNEVVSEGLSSIERVRTLEEENVLVRSEVSY
ncbi:hypothetical protein LWI29_027599 [Acer saccharum]|uniref:Uncharacterized protein n=1 Tax=Acer saccharum TaxID=4024 RepID=A0AA39SLY4_ACESA|nr:hypothetical protein LWI29_027599 [Acer saccharum]